MNNLREELSDLSHEIWSHWMRWMFEQGGYSTIQVDDNGKFITFWTMEPERYERWQRQMNTSYHDLTEQEKDSDREQADKIIAVVRKYAIGEYNR